MRNKRNLIVSAALILTVLAGVALSQTTITRRQMGLQDISLWDGVTRTFTYTGQGGLSYVFNKMGMKVDVLQVYGGGTNYTGTTLSSAITAIGTVNKVGIELSPGTWIISSDITIPSNITLYPVPGTSVKPASGKTLIANVAPTGYFKWIDTSSGGVVHPIGDEVKPDWWGTDGPSIQSAANTVKYVTNLTSAEDYSQNVGASLSLKPGGIYSSAQSLFFGGTSVNCVRFIDGHGAVIVSSIASQPAMDFTGAYRGHYKDFSLECTASGPPDVGVLLARPTGSPTGASSGNHLFERVNVRGSVIYSLVYNYAAEACTFVQCLFSLDAGQTTFIGNRSNSRSITSPGTTIASGNQSATNIGFINCAFWNRVNAVAGVNDSCLEIDSFRNGSLTNCAFAQLVEDKPAIRVTNNGSQAPNNWTISGGNRIDTMVGTGIQIECATLYGWFVPDMFWGSSTSVPSNGRWQIKNTVATDFHGCYFNAPNVDISVAGSSIQDNCTFDVTDHIYSESNLKTVGVFEGTAIIRPDTVFTYEAAYSRAKVSVPESGIEYRHNPMTDMADHASTGTGLQILLEKDVLDIGALRAGATLCIRTGGTIAGTNGTKVVTITIGSEIWTVVSAAAGDTGDYHGYLELYVENATSEATGIAYGGLTGKYPSVTYLRSTALDFEGLRTIRIKANPANAGDTITNKYFQAWVR
jgi:hypothetical protein